jgi:putative transposase
MIELARQTLSGNSALSISEVCKVLCVSRSSLYRDGKVVVEDVDLCDEIQQIALEMPCYGYRRISKELGRRGRLVNHKRVLRLMREDNLLCLRKRKFVTTTDSEHCLPVYPNLVRDLLVDGTNRLWVADITYVRLCREFVYLAVVLDGFSRRCIGWNLGRRLDDALTAGALEMALDAREVRRGLIHHSDRGVQYASRAYTGTLSAHGIAISMSRSGNPYDNAKAESFIKTLKYEEVYLSEYLDIDDARESIGHFIEQVYNSKRLHSALGYLPPAEFEQLNNHKETAVFP